MKKYWSVLLLVISAHAFAQSYNDDAVLYSQNALLGTARTAGTGGAFGSVGADLGSLAINPAGIGLYRSMDFSITPGLLINKNEAAFDGSFKNQSATKLVFSQAGIVFTKLYDRSSNQYSFNPNKLNSFSFGITYQRKNNFSRTQSFYGSNSSNSGIDAYTNYVNSNHLPIDVNSSLPEIYLAYQTYLIDYDTINQNFFSNVRAPLAQSGTITTKGGTDEVNITMGGNVSDKFYFGFNIGIPILTQLRTTAIKELNTGDATSSFQEYVYNSSIRTTGLGVTGKLGIIYRPAAWVRVGLAYHLPSFYSISESSSYNTVATFDSFYSTLPDNLGYFFKYKMRTPMRGVASTSFFIKDHGFFSVDYEFLNYGASHFNLGSAYQSDSKYYNDFQKAHYTFGHVVRAGFEGSYKSLRVRTGYSYSSSPFKKADRLPGYTGDKHNATLGIGYRGKRFYADAAYVFGITKDVTYPYADFEVKNTVTSHAILLTIGWKISKDATSARRRQAPAPARVPDDQQPPQQQY